MPEADRILALQASRRKSHMRRRAVVYGVDAEVFDPFEIFERDGWICHLCGKKTRIALRGQKKPLAPELDHIIPISRGGPHTRLNTACSCYKCNAHKSTKIIGQPSLLALL